MADRIEKKTLLRAPIDRVWRAISDAKEFGSWFGVRFDGPFVTGQPIRGRITPTTVNPEVAESQKAYEGATFDITVDRVEPQRLFSFRWHPFAVEPAHDYSKEPTTLVEFVLIPAGEGTLLTITESGFDGIPLERRARAFTMNEQGWAGQIVLIGMYVDRAS